MIALTTQPQQPILPFPQKDIRYRAIGLVPGSFTVSNEDKSKGTFLLDNKYHLDAAIIPRSHSRLKNLEIKQNQNYNWLCYPRTNRDGDIVKLMLINAYPPDSNLELQNYFYIRGEVVKQDNGILIVKIVQTAKNYEFRVRIDGYMPKMIWSQFWDFKCYRDETQLFLEDAELIFKPKRYRKKSRSSTGTNLDIDS
ncbi:MAG TPA: hypothetical protein V6D15_00335 [Oculatellaceae cyanobacterium]|jgi:hypothetical protein